MNGLRDNRSPSFYIMNGSILAPVYFIWIYYGTMDGSIWIHEEHRNTITKDHRKWFRGIISEILPYEIVK